MKIDGKPLLSYSQRLRRLRYFTIAFMLFILIPLGIILYFGFQQLEKNVLEKYQRTSKKLDSILYSSLSRKRHLSNALPVDAFDYYRQVYNPIISGSQQTISPLAKLDYDEPKKKWFIGYFQYCSSGHFNSPIWPYLLPDKILYNDLHGLSKQPSNQQLNSESAKRKKNAIKIYELLLQSESLQSMVSEMSEQDFSPKDEFFNISFDLPEYFIFYRYVYAADHYWLQGYVVKRSPYLSQIIMEILGKLHFENSVLVELKDVNHSGAPDYFFYENIPSDKMKVSLLQKPHKQYQQQTIFSSNLLWPYNSYSLKISTNHIPATPTMIYSHIFIVILIIAILLACYGFYRLGTKQLILGEQRLNFVSSVSHELKTPLTSIRMYSQMLKEGTVITETHKKNYYEFIHSESERLTRLINNILQLSSLSNHQQDIQPEYIQLNLLVDIICSKTSTIIDKHNFKQNLILDIDNPEGILVLVEQDAFAQVIINITDNAIKFFDTEKINDHARQKIDFIFRQQPKQRNIVQLEIRDYGEGITAEQESKIFELFYRGGNELTRTTQGTGIGLALVNELVLVQQGEIKIERKNPGLAMILSFQCKLDSISKI